MVTPLPYPTSLGRVRVTDKELTNLLETVAWDVRQKDGWQTTSDSAVPRLVAEVRAARSALAAREALLRECLEVMGRGICGLNVTTEGQAYDLLQRIEAELGEGRDG